MFAREGHAGEDGNDQLPDDIIGEGHDLPEEDEGHEIDEEPEDEGNITKDQMMVRMRSDGFSDKDMQIMNEQILMGHKAIIAGTYVFEAMTEKKFESDFCIFCKQSENDEIHDILVKSLKYKQIGPMGKMATMYSRRKSPDIVLRYSDSVKKAVSRFCNLNVGRFYYDGTAIRSYDFIDTSIIKVVGVENEEEWTTSIITAISIKQKLGDKINIDYDSVFDSLVDLDMLMDVRKSRVAIRTAYDWNITAKQKGLDDNLPLFYQEPGELLFIYKDVLIGSTRVFNNEIEYTNDKPVVLTENEPGTMIEPGEERFDNDYRDDTGAPNTCLDFVMADDTTINEYVKERTGLAIWIGSTAFCIPVSQIINIFSPDPLSDRVGSMGIDDIIFYKCLVEQPKPVEEEQYFLIRLNGNFLVPLEDIRKMVRYYYQHGVKIFKLDKALDATGKQIEFRYTISHGVAIHYMARYATLRKTREGSSAISSDHCQEGSNKLLYRLYPVSSETINRPKSPIRERDMEPYYKETLHLKSENSIEQKIYDDYPYIVQLGIESPEQFVRQIRQHMSEYGDKILQYILKFYSEDKKNLFFNVLHIESLNYLFGLISLYPDVVQQVRNQGDVYKLINEAKQWQEHINDHLPRDLEEAVLNNENFTYQLGKYISTYEMKNIRMRQGVLACCTFIYNSIRAGKRLNIERDSGLYRALRYFWFNASGTEHPVEIEELYYRFPSSGDDKNLEKFKKMLLDINKSADNYHTEIIDVIYGDFNYLLLTQSSLVVLDIVELVSEFLKVSEIQWRNLPSRMNILETLIKMPYTTKLKTKLNLPRYNTDLRDELVREMKLISDANVFHAGDELPPKVLNLFISGDYNGFIDYTDSIIPDFEARYSLLNKVIHEFDKYVIALEEPERYVLVKNKWPHMKDMITDFSIYKDGDRKPEISQRVKSYFLYEFLHYGDNEYNPRDKVPRSITFSFFACDVNMFSRELEKYVRSTNTQQEVMYKLLESVTEEDGDRILPCVRRGLTIRNRLIQIDLSIVMNESVKALMRSMYKEYDRRYDPAYEGYNPPEIITQTLATIGPHTDEKEAERNFMNALDLADVHYVREEELGKQLINAFNRISGYIHPNIQNNVSNEILYEELTSIMWA